MNEHMRVGHDYPTIRQALAYSFGLDSQDFVVAYETDDLVAFGDLVRALRATESRRSTVSDTPILLGIHRPMDEILDAAGSRLMAGIARVGSRTRRARRRAPSDCSRAASTARSARFGPSAGRRSSSSAATDRTSGMRTGGATWTTSARGGRRSSGHATPR